MDCERALAEDIGSGDLSAGVLAEKARLTARVTAKEQGVLCGVSWFETCIRSLDDQATFIWECEEGKQFRAGSQLVRLSAQARALLSAERTALNFLQTLSGTATKSRRVAQISTALGIEVMDTRKTLPGLRIAQKYAVWVGGCSNHRLGLWDCVMIKENHVVAYGSLEAAIVAGLKQSQERKPSLPLVVEVRSLSDLKLALDAGVKHVLLDNLANDDGIRQAVALCAEAKANLEVSGNLDEDGLKHLSELGVKLASSGALTKHLKAPDMTMLLENA